MGGPGGFRGEHSDGMDPPEGFDPSALPEDGSDGRHPPAVPTENGQPPEDRPEAENGVQAEQPPEPPAGTFEKTSPSDGGRPAESAEGADGAPQSADFVLTDGSNFFTGITTVEGFDTGADSEN